MKTNRNNRPYPHFKFPDEIIISIKKMNEADIKWFNALPNSYCFSCANYGWFPTGALMGVKDGKFTDSNNLGITISGNMGTASIALTNAREAVIMLQNLGYNIETESGLIL